MIPKIIIEVIKERERYRNRYRKLDKIFRQL
jgi:hypothetical protein